MWRIVSVAAALVLAAASAQAGEASAVAERGGFLLGHAYRCGVEDQRLEAPARLVHDLIAALGQCRGNGGRRPSLRRPRSGERIRRGFARPSPILQFSPPRVGSVRAASTGAISARRDAPCRAIRAPRRPPKSTCGSLKCRGLKNLTETRHENLTPSQRGDLGRKLAAKEQRNHPPSI